MLLTAAQQRLHRIGEVSYVLAPGFMLVMGLGGFLDGKWVIGLAGVAGAAGFGLALRGRAASRAG